MDGTYIKIFKLAGKPSIVWAAFLLLSGGIKMEGEQKMNDKDIVNKMLSESLDGQRYLCYRRSHPQDTARLAEGVLGMVAQHEMFVSAAKGFFDYMKTVVERRSRITGSA